MNRKIEHIVATFALLLLSCFAMGQTDIYEYVENGSKHALSVLENPAYKFVWTVTDGSGNAVNVGTDSTHVTGNIKFTTTGDIYYVKVYPILDSVGCKGEPVDLYIKILSSLPLHAFDDTYYTDYNTTLTANVSDNDFDDLGYELIYTVVVDSTPNGIISLFSNGTFIYSPNTNFSGVDSFTYEVCNSADASVGEPHMCDEATVYITVGAASASTSADIVVTKTGPAKALYGSEILYTIVVKNNGPDLAESVLLNDDLPIDLINASYSLNYSTFKTWTGSLLLGDIKAGDSVLVQIRVTVSKNSDNWVYNQALAYSNDTSPTPDPEPANNDSTWPTEILNIFAEPGSFTVALCDPDTIWIETSSVSGVSTYLWSPATYLSDSTIANPVFTPNESVADSVLTYVVTITDSLGNIAIDTVTVTVPEAVEIVMLDTMYVDKSTLPDTIVADQSHGVSLSYFWTTTNSDAIIGSNTASNLAIQDTGTFYLEVKDKYSCSQTDSILVMYTSYPPIAINDTVSIVAGTDSTFNVLTNDSDINGFPLRVTQIITAPNHGTYSWDSSGNITFQPDEFYWNVDSIEYQVCNSGYPEQCSTAWVFINCIRPPRNADVAIVKTGVDINFWADTMYYNLSVYNQGPDTVAQVTVYDPIYSSLTPRYYSVYDGATWSEWNAWSGYYTSYDSLFPSVYDDLGQLVAASDTLKLKIKAYINIHTGDVTIINKAYIETTIKENDYNNDTSTVSTEVKEPVVADAGKDFVIGACQTEGITIDGSGSTGQNLTYLWTSNPSSAVAYLDNTTSEQPVFTRPSNITDAMDIIYILTITDDDGITDKDTVIVHLLAPPVADAGPDIALELIDGEQTIATVDGSGSTPSGSLSYSWTTTDGDIIGGGSSEVTMYADTLGTYTLTVTDSAGCTSSDDMIVYQYFLPPFAIPDYYSINMNQTLTGNLITYDYEPNEIFELSAEPFSGTTINGGTLSIDALGNFTYKPKSGKTGYDYFSYTVCNNAPVHPGCSNGYVFITIVNKGLTTTKCANLNIRKQATENPVFTSGDIRFTLMVTNLGPDDATDVFVVDSTSEYITNVRNVDSPTSSTGQKWIGGVKITSLPVGDTVYYYLKGTVSSDAPSRLFNAAMVYSQVNCDESYNWLSIENRNVDTASVVVRSDLYAVLELYEDKSDDDTTDNVIGSCRTNNILDASKSYVEGSSEDSVTYTWQPSYLVTSSSGKRTKIKTTNFTQDTTVTFVLIMTRNGKNSVATQVVTISKAPYANAGADRKINSGGEVVLDATASYGADPITVTWIEKNASFAYEFEDGDSLRPIITDVGTFYLYITDHHGCYDIDTVTVRENSLMAVDDIAVVVEDVVFTGNVATNDYDPDLDSVIYSGEVIESPAHGTLTADPPEWDGTVVTSDSRLIAPDGTYVYTPDAGYIGSDYFTYKVCDNNDPDLCVEGKVYINVISPDTVNSPPVVNHDELFVNKSSNAISDNLLYNDYDLDGNSIYANDTSFTTVLGNISITTVGDLTYTPKVDSTGTDQFSYDVCDNGIPKECNSGGVNVYIHKMADDNHKPVAVDDAYYVIGNPISGNVLDNDYDPDENQSVFLQPELIVAPKYGTVEMSEFGDGSFTYTPNANYEGTDQFVYQICDDASSQECAMATVYLTSLSNSRFTSDMEIVKTGTKEILSGGTIEYTLIFKVNGPSQVNDVSVIDQLPQDLTDLEYSLNGIDWYAWSGEYDIDWMDVYSSDTIQVRGTTPFYYDTIVTNTAYVWHGMNEKDSSDNVSSWSTNVYQSIVADAGNDTVIGGCVTKYQLSALGSVGLVADSLNYLWLPAKNLDNNKSPTPVLTTTPGTSVTLTLIVSGTYNGLYDADTVQVTITVTKTPVAVAGDNVYELADSYLLDGSESSGVGTLDYSWWVIDDEYNVDVKGSTDTLTVYRSDYYYLTVTDSMGCTATDSVYIGFKMEPYEAIIDWDTIYQGETDTVHVLWNDIIDEEDSYQMDQLLVIEYPTHGTVTVNRLDSTILYTPDLYYFGADSFHYSMTTINNTDDAWVYIIVLPRKPVVPLGFSPNGDGINDVLIIENIDLYPNNKLTVFNRWGNIVYEKQSYTNDEPWDGIANKGVRLGHGIVPTGTYLYILELGVPENSLLSKEITDAFKEPLRSNIYISASD